MSAHQFVFPPPPPPPPPAVNPNYANRSGPPEAHNYGHGTRGNNGDRASHVRGYNGLKHNSRGGTLGSVSTTGYNALIRGNDSHLSSHESYRPPTNMSGNSYPLPEYPPVQPPQYLPNVPNAYGNPVATHPTGSVAPFISNPQYHNNPPRFAQFLGSQPQSAPYTYNPPPQVQTYYPPEPRHHGPGPPRPGNPGQPAFMGPPLRMGFKTADPGQNQPMQAHPPIYQPPPAQLPHVKPSDHRNREQRRNHGGPGGQRRFQAKIQVAPAVPSFGNPLPLKPPPPQEIGRKPKKKKRRHNQLGLTPKTVEHESSEDEENDLDEEAKLATAVGLPESEHQQLQFSYRGRLSTLKSASDVTAWIEERKKRFPTKLKVEARIERQRLSKEAKEVAKQIARKSKVKQKAVVREKQKPGLEETKLKVDEKPNESHKDKAESKEAKLELSLSTDNAAVKSKLKMEKLRKRLEKEERRVAKAEAKVSKLKVQVSDFQFGDSALDVSPLAQKRKRSNSVESEVEVKMAEAQQIKLEQVSLLNAPAPVALGQESILGIKREDDEAYQDVEPTPTEVTRLVASSTAHGPLTPTSQPSMTEDVDVDSSRHSVQPTSQLLASSPKFAVLGSHQDDFKELNGLNNAQLSGSSHVSEGSLSSSSVSLSSDSEDDLTSSEDSSTSSGSASEPDTRSLKRAEPEKIAPPTQDKPGKVCRDFLRSGRCGLGDRCKFRHVAPRRQSQAQKKKHLQEEKTKRMIGLYQRLVEQERQTEKAEAIQKRKEKEKEEANDLLSLGTPAQLG